MYCIYTDRDVEQADGNWDHVVPLALGGDNGFVVWSDRDANSTLGSQVDGKLTRDPLLAFALREAGVTGHSGKPVVPVWKRVEIDGRPTQVTWGKEKITTWDARDRRELADDEVAGKAMNATLQIDTHVTTRFLAKVALGTGQFLYGDLFRQGVDCAPLRDLAFLDLEGARESAVLRMAEITICDRFHPDAGPRGGAAMYRALLEATNRSLVIAVPHHDAIAVHVGLVGAYIGSIVFPAQTGPLPPEGDHDLGHYLALAPGTLERGSFRSLCGDFYAAQATAAE